MVLDAETWAEVAAIVGKAEPALFAGHVAAVGVWDNAADVLPERNNHGHLLIREHHSDHPHR